MSEPLIFDCSGMSIEEMEKWGTWLVELQKRLNWRLGDIARAARAKLGDEHYSQVFPTDASPGAIQRWEAVATAYPNEADRNPLATWTIHMKEANHPDRIARVQAHVEAGHSSDEAAKANQEERAEDNRPRWLIAFDVHYFVHRFFHSGADVETAMQVAGWLQRTINRLKEKGATDVLCAFEGTGSFRKDLTTGWETPYKSKRGPKDPVLLAQLQLMRELLDSAGFCTHSVNQYEADDVLASAAKQFDGRVTIVSADKDLKQCLSDRVNILRDVTWEKDESTGDLLPNYHWFTAKDLMDETGLRPEQFPGLQAIQGDAVDSVAGAPGIGEKGALNLMQKFGSVTKCIEAARNNDEELLAMPRGKTMVAGLLELDTVVADTLSLVTLRNDLPVPSATRV